ncbi:DUF1266 domain-containing protein [Gracilibacillus oryzae]|uniref:DUF1266 domain-containing protein n=1 Tax=Gracilibacillus oryzae TaxID=1672701 RepID=A0A7C8GVZ8_9BACI|nr:DUF1266 domain-containing protein [Gracilibacillus oryzae]KAB8139339.1 DUF1266 domain-containing protein [Gracilibacillus oryzae]
MTRKVPKEIKQFVTAILVLNSRKEYILAVGLWPYWRHKKLFRNGLKARKIENKQDLEEGLDWCFEKGGRSDFDTAYSRISLMPMDSRQFILKTMSQEDDNFHKCNGIHHEMHRIPLGGILAVDMTEYLFIALAGQRLGYLTEEEAAERFRSGLKKLQENYRDWNEFIVGYNYGMQHHSANFSNEYARINKRYLRTILLAKRSPMNKINWQMSLDF